VFAGEWIVQVEKKVVSGEHEGIIHEQFAFDSEDEARSEYHRLVESEKSEPRYWRIELGCIDKDGDQEAIDDWQANDDDDGA
jgi:hypothetical protein